MKPQGEHSSGKDCQQGPDKTRGKGRRKGKTIKPKILQSRKGKKQHLLMGTMDSMLVNITLLSAWKNAWTVAEETGGLSEQLEQA